MKITKDNDNNKIFRLLLKPYKFLVLEYYKFETNSVWIY